jgi:hypothetical protein
MSDPMYHLMEIAIEELSITKLLCMLRVIRLAEKGHNPIYHIIIY